MSLIYALNVTQLGLMDTETRMNLVTQNITNADKPGYSRKEYGARYLTTTGVGSVPIRGVYNGSINQFLVKSVVGDVSDMARARTVSNSLDYYAKRLGNTDSGYTIVGTMNMLFASLQRLSYTPENAPDKAQVVNDAQAAAYQFNALSGEIQKLRLQADQQIEQSVNRINDALTQINTLNYKLRDGVNNDVSIAEFEDQRARYLQVVAEELDIQYFISSDNILNIYTAGGQALVNSTPHVLDHTALSSVNSTVTYPAIFDTIDLDGVDITTSVRSGTLAGLIQLRDTILVNEQAKLDELATTFMDEINAVLNTGASVPSRNVMTGVVDGLLPGSLAAATGFVRLSTTDSAGVVQAYYDIDLSTTGGTVIGIMAAINAFPEFTAVLDADGQLQISAVNPAHGVAINEMDSSVGPSGRGFSHFFGLNNLFEGTGSENMAIAAYLQTSPDYLAVSVLSNSLTLAVGDIGVSAGNGATALAAANILKDANVSFSAAGGFAAQNTSIFTYAEKFTSNAAYAAALAENDYTTLNLTYEQTVSLLNNEAGVNVDEETAKMIELEAKYGASATMIATIRNMFEALLAAVR
ncbi:MAG: flagellar hook-associated protein FlgK [Alphaproteobacteria bacterium]|nr:flagellar hook-associated protein FlgK [Alphaproteobacteria bacterium]